MPPRPGCERETTVEYDVAITIASLAALRARVVSVDPERAAMFDAREDELGARPRAARRAGRCPGERRFLQPMRADLLRPLSG